MTRLALRPLAAILLACGALAASSCGAVNPLAAVVAKTSATKGAKVDMRIDMTVPGAGSVSLSGGGVIDLAGSRGSLSMRSARPLPGLGSGFAIDEVIDGKTLYMRLNGLPQASLGGKHWFKVDLDEAASRAGVDLGAMQSPGSSDPGQTLRWLEGADDVERLGSEVVRGTRCDHYQAVIDLDEVADELPADQRDRARSGIEQLRRLGAPDRIPTDVWVDGRGLLRRQALRYEQNLPGGPGMISMQMVMDLHSYGTPVRIQRPDSADVLDLTDFAASALQGRLQH